MRNAVVTKCLTVCILCLLGGIVRAGQSQSLVPANFNQITDSQGFIWDVNQSGAMNNGTNYAFSNALVLRVDGNNFYSQQPMMTADGKEFVLSQNMGALQVARQISVDSKNGAIRYVEVLTNPTGADIASSISLQTRFNNRVQNVVTSGGAIVQGGLGKNEVGVLAIHQPNGNRPSLLFWLNGRSSKVQPQIQVNNNYEMYVTYAVTVPAGKSVAIMHGMAQRYVQGMQQPKQLDKLFKSFRPRRWARDLPADVRKSLLNAQAGWDGVALNATLDKLLSDLGITRGTADILAIGGETRLLGSATCQQVRIDTSFGGVQASIDDVAAIIGPRHGGVARVLMRNGQSFAGKVVLDSLRFTTRSGLEMDLSVEGIDHLVMHEALKKDGPNPEAVAYLDTYRGERLALADSPELKLRFVTPWGPVSVGLNELLWLRMTEEADPGCIVALRNGSRFFGYRIDQPMTVVTKTFAAQSIQPSEVRSLVTVGSSQSADESVDVYEPHALLYGENRLVGRIDLANLHFIVGNEVIPVAPAQIRQLRNLSDGDLVLPGDPLRFKAELWGGGEVAGELREQLLPLRMDDAVFQVPVGDVVEVNVPTPHVSESMMARIADNIRQLGADEWEVRETATRELRSLGFMAKQQLEEALTRATDPEVRKRVRNLLDEL